MVAGRFGVCAYVCSTVFLINVIPSNFSLGGWKIAMTPESALVIALALYATGLASEHAVEAFRQTRMGSPVALWEFFLNLARVYFSLVLASGFGAAIGVAEAVNVTRRAMDALPTLSDKFMMLGMVIGAFTLLFQTLYRIEKQLRNSTRQSYAPVGRRLLAQRVVGLRPHVGPAFALLGHDFGHTGRDVADG